MIVTQVFKHPEDTPEQRQERVQALLEPYFRELYRKRRIAALASQEGDKTEEAHAHDGND